MTPDAVQERLLDIYKIYRNKGTSEFVAQIDGLVRQIRQPKQPERFQALCRHCQRVFEGEGELGAVRSVEQHEEVCKGGTCQTK